LNVKVIILDFDGVILESQGIKDWAFEELFKDSNKLEEILAYHTAHKATIRFEKFKHITEDILGQKYTPDLKDKLSQEFSNLVFEKLTDCPFVDGVVDFLDYYTHKVPLYVASVNPHDDLEKIIEMRDLKKYFKRIYAHPWRKEKAIRDILREEHISSCDAVFIGDSYEDYLAAKDAGVVFIGRSSNNSLQSISGPVFENMSQVKSFLQSH
jgi:phosphoglycolate phosphatase-like HAD superfamily hydrolase